MCDFVLFSKLRLIFIDYKYFLDKFDVLSQGQILDGNLDRFAMDWDELTENSIKRRTGYIRWVMVGVSKRGLAFLIYLKLIIINK